MAALFPRVDATYAKGIAITQIAAPFSSAPGLTPAEAEHRAEAAVAKE